MSACLVTRSSRLHKPAPQDLALHMHFHIHIPFHVQVIAGGHHSGALDQIGCLHLWGRSFTSQPDSAIPTTVQHAASQQVVPVEPDDNLKAKLHDEAAASGHWKQVCKQQQAL